MRILLIGKYPPLQGGVATKAFWLTNALRGEEIVFDVVTCNLPMYATEASAARAPGPAKNVCVLGPESVPWWIPQTDLWIERLAGAALSAADTARPDVVEANYLAPFGSAAALVARTLGIPFLLRHAGSDIQKLLAWPPTERAFRGLLRTADRVATTPDAYPRLRTLVSPSALVELPRYTPDPAAFLPAPPPAHGEARLLVAGKLNYHWRLKALDSLLVAMERHAGWRLTIVGDGVGRLELEQEVDRHGLRDRAEWHPFVEPEHMPALIGTASAVWAVERPGGVSDFSNLVWEAAALGRTCFVSAATAAHPDAAPLRAARDLVCPVDPDDPVAVGVALDYARTSASPRPLAGLGERFASYVAANVRYYREAFGCHAP